MGAAARGLRGLSPSRPGAALPGTHPREQRGRGCPCRGRCCFPGQEQGGRPGGAGMCRMYPIMLRATCSVYCEALEEEGMGGRGELQNSKNRKIAKNIKIAQISLSPPHSHILAPREGHKAEPRARRALQAPLRAAMAAGGRRCSAGAMGPEGCGCGLRVSAGPGVMAKW